jgi:hypothetical protein
VSRSGRKLSPVPRLDAEARLEAAGFRRRDPLAGASNAAIRS